MQDFIGGGCCLKAGDGPASPALAAGAKFLDSLLLFPMIIGF